MPTLKEYDAFTAETDSGKYGNGLAYPALGIAGEAGEVADKVKKLWRNKDVQDAMARRIGSSFEQVLEKNIKKLLDRRARGVIKSEGDNR